METLTSFQTVRDGKQFGLTVSVEASNNYVRLLLTILAPEPNVNPNIEIRIEIDTRTGLLAVESLAGLTGVEACLAACAVKSLVGPLIECFNKNPKKYIECLKSKGIGLSKDIIECAILCGLGGQVVST
jgi:hypothetical protein